MAFVLWVAQSAVAAAAPRPQRPITQDRRLVNAPAHNFDNVLNVDFLRADDRILNIVPPAVFQRAELTLVLIAPCVQISVHSHCGRMTVLLTVAQADLADLLRNTLNSHWFV